MTRKSAILFLAVAAFALPALPIPAQPPEKPLTVDAIFAHGPLIGEPPDQLTWSPDGKHLTYLDGGELMDVDPVTGKTHVLVSAAKMAKPRRQQRLRAGPRSSPALQPGQLHLVSRLARIFFSIPTAGSGFMTCAMAPESRSAFPACYRATIPSSRPTASPSRSSAITAWPLFRFASPARPPLPLAPAPSPPTGDGQQLLNGEVDWVYEEELDVRSNYFWSPDSKNIAYLQMNETQVPQYPLTDWIPAHAHGGLAALSAARRSQSRRACGRGERAGRQDGLDQAAHSRRATITSRALAGSTAKRFGSKR